MNWASLRGTEKVHWIIVTGGQFEIGFDTGNLLLISDREKTGTGWGDRDVTPQVSSHAQSLARALAHADSVSIGPEPPFGTSSYFESILVDELLGEDPYVDLI